LPVLLEQRHEVVDGQHCVLADFVFLHVDVTDAAAQAQHLLELELDRRLQILGLLGKVVTECDRGRELVETVQVRTDNTRNGLDDGLGGEERIIASAELLHELLVLVEFLEVFHVESGQVLLLRLLLVLEVADDADAHVGAAQIRQAESASETLVLLGVVVLQVDLKINRLGELALLALGENLLDGVLQNLRRDLRHGVERFVFFFSLVSV